MNRTEETKQAMRNCAEKKGTDAVKSILVKNPAGAEQKVFVLRNGNMDDSIQIGGNAVSEETFKEMILANGFEIIEEKETGL